MLLENKNLKDINLPRPNLPLNKGEEQGGGLSYTKTNKLITALYMVTDILNVDEPLRKKLRTLGVEIISDINSNPPHACAKISDLLSFLDIASAVNIISTMNCNILRKEFVELNNSIKESFGKMSHFKTQVNLSEFFVDSPLEGQAWGRDSSLKSGVDKHLPPPPKGYSGRGELNSQGHKGHTRLGVQKGSTLMQALSDKALGLSDMGEKNSRVDNFEIKTKRRNSIINIIKFIGVSATIKDIKDKIKTLPEEETLLASASEKTLQRELVSMVKDSVLNKTGEKRWSRYFLK